MEVTVNPPQPPPPPPPTYDITGLTKDEAVFLRDLTGRFSCSSSVTAHMHSALFSKLYELTGNSDTEYTFEVTNRDWKRPVLRCRRRGESRDD
jgi:hypothetical protein